MENFEILDDEIILYKGKVKSIDYGEKLKITLTSIKLFIEQEQTQGSFALLDTILLNTIKLYKEVAQVKQKINSVEIQSTHKNFTLTFTNPLDARTFTSKIINAVTNTTTAERASQKFNKSADLVDSTLHIDSRELIKNSAGAVSNIMKGISNFGRKGKNN